MENLTAFIVALASLLVASGGFLKIWYDVRQIHTIVNSQRTAMVEKIDELRKIIAERASDGRTET